ncbi:MAG: hypothetical protein ACRCV9_02130 [Burkholderiaceae bacterium]
MSIANELRADDVRAIWRNGVSNTIALMDVVRKRHASKMKRSKFFAEFDRELNALMDDWYRDTRSAAPKSWEEADDLFKKRVDAFSRAIAAAEEAGE